MNKLDKYIEAVNIFNNKHRKYKVYFDNRELGYFRFAIISEKVDKVNINFKLAINDNDTIDEIIEVLEDLKRDLK